MSPSMLPRQPLAPPPNLQPRLPSTGPGRPLTDLTDHQKKIVGEFKANLARLPPEQHADYIAHNKQTLIKQLNFHPSQVPFLSRQPALSQQQEQIPVVVGCQVVPPGAHPPRIQLNPLRSSQDTAPTPILYKKQKSKQELAAWVESQMKKDQQEALN